jgi:hypothetical protein
MGITWAVYIGFCWSGQSKNTRKNSGKNSHKNSPENSRADNAIPIASAAMSLYAGGNV